MRWMELILRAILVMSLYFYLMSRELMSPPIVELALILIYSAQFSLTQSNTNKNWPMLVFLVECFLTAIYFPLIFFFLPVVYYELVLKDIRQSIIFLLIPVLGIFLDYGIYSSLFISGLAFLVSYLNTMMVTRQSFERASYEEIDSLRFLNQRFRNEQQHLLELENNRIESSIKSERRRIVEEIHDLLGHQLSSAVIQIGALGYLVKDEEVKKSLTQVKELLDTSMQNVRKVIHAERETTIVVRDEIQAIIDQFTKAEVNFIYENSHSMNNQTAHSIVYIIKEALTNINKHSDAQLVHIRLVELVDKWTLLISDNGKQKSDIKFGSGIGLLSIEERVNQLNGSLHISNESGFRIFITVPKEAAR